jgi:hypothetical protein
LKSKPTWLAPLGVRPRRFFYLQGMLQGATNPLAWIGSSIAVYADDDPFWKELAQQPDDRWLLWDWFYLSFSDSTKGDDS